MPICKNIKCREKFPNRVRIEGKLHILNKRKYCLRCSPFGIHNTRPIDSYTNMKRLGRKCSECGRTYIYDRRKGHRVRVCHACISLRKRVALKKRMVEFKGGKCSRCGYNKCFMALDFHHKDSKKKNFSISGAHCHSWERIKKELQKCVLVCANCHRELHEK